MGTVNAAVASLAGAGGAAQVQDSLAASASLAPSANAVNTALATKTDNLAAAAIGAGTTAITRAAHLNRPLSVNQAGATTGTFAATATSGALAGDGFELLNEGAGTFTAAGAITAAAGYSLTAGPGTTFTALYDAIADAFRSTTPIIAANPATANNWAIAQTSDESAVAYAASITLDAAAVSNHINIGALTGNLTLANPTGFTKAVTLNVWLTQDGTGSRTLTLGNKIKTAGAAGITLSTAASAVDLLALTYNPTKDIWFAAIVKAVS